MMCTEKHRAHSRTKKSPFSSRREPLMHSRYRPKMAMTTLTHSLAPTFLRKKRPRMGTMTMYRAVIKPALPTVVYWMPTCCRQEATPRARPQETPPARRVLRLAFSAWRRSGVFIRSNTRITGIKARPPTTERTVLKVKGPMWSMPTAWATKAVPQMKAARKSIHKFLVGN